MTKQPAILSTLAIGAILTLGGFVTLREAPVTLAVDLDGNKARYLVQEQLVGFKLPNMAMGETSEVMGEIRLDSTGALVPAASMITVVLTGLESDSDRRDGYVRSRILETDKYSSVVLQPRSIEGLAQPLPESGSTTFTLKGDLTVRNVTRPTTWKVQAQFNGKRITGRATTSFTFEDFGLTQPRVPVVLSVSETITLEYDFSFVRQQQGD